MANDTKNTTDKPPVHPWGPSILVSILLFTEGGVDLPGNGGAFGAQTTTQTNVRRSSIEFFYQIRSFRIQCFKANSEAPDYTWMVPESRVKQWSPLL